MSDPDDDPADLEDFDPTPGPDFDADLVIDAIEKRPARTPDTQAAWQRLDERKEAEWLREQLSDWDDWDDGEDAEVH